MLKTKSAGGIVLNEKCEVLIVNQNHLSWSLPKGHVEANETDLEAAIREIYEEAGVSQVELIQPLGSYSRYRIGLNDNDDKAEYKTLVFFLFTTKETLLSPKDPNNPIAKWVNRANVKPLLTHKADQKFYVDQLPIIENLINNACAI
jgi:bis(5'-nucleosidyl)-tetraphosphatase